MSLHEVSHFFPVNCIHVKPLCKNRYSATLNAVVAWIETDMSDPKSEGRVAVEKVRCMHNHVSQLMEKLGQESDLLKPRPGTVWVSQKDMVVTLFAFIGLGLLYPEACGFLFTDDEKDDAIHFWRLIGHLMGIPEEFNILSGIRDEVMDLCEIIMSEVYMPILNKSVTADETVVVKSQGMAVDTVTATAIFVPVMTGRVLHQYWAKAAGSETDIELTLIEKIRLSTVRLVVGALLPIGWFRSIASRIWFANYHSVMNNRRCVADKMRKQDPEVKYKLCDLQKVNQ